MFSGFACMLRAKRTGWSTLCTSAAWVETWALELDSTGVSETVLLWNLIFVNFMVLEFLRGYVCFRELTL